jgi:uncharacterized membrane protein YesL
MSPLQLLYTLLYVYLFPYYAIYYMKIYQLDVENAFIYDL